MSNVREIRCKNWADIPKAITRAKEMLDVKNGEFPWFRGSKHETYDLLPTLMRDTLNLSDEHHFWAEQDLFFEFQAIAKELRERGLTDWEYLFYARHFGLPTRVLDWTDTVGVALYFALEDFKKAPKSRTPAIFVINPYALNEESHDERDIILPRYLGLIEDEEGGEEFWDFGEMLASADEWPWEGPVAIYPIQLNERVRAQRGWFTIHGNSRDSLEEQFPNQVVKIVLEKSCHEKVNEFLDMAGFNRFSIYPDLDNLAGWIKEKTLHWANTYGPPKTDEPKTHKSTTRRLKASKAGRRKLQR